MAKKNGKQPKRAVEPHPAKQVKQQERPEIDEDGILWSFALFDDCADWATDHEANHFRSVASHLKSKQGLTWSVIRGNHERDHPIPIGNLSKEAQHRLGHLHMDDVDELISLHFTGRQRIWGVKYGCVFQILWWDPDHRVCPSNWPHN